MGEDCVDNKNSDPPLGDGTGYINSATYNLSDHGWGTAFWDGDTYVSKSFYGDPNVIMRKKIDTILERIQIIDSTLLAVLEELRQLKKRTKSELIDEDV
jgi:hypothetical protein